MIEFQRTNINQPTVDGLSRVLTEVQSWLERDAKSLNDEAFRDSRLLTSQVLTAGVLNKVVHGLGRPVQGFLVTRKNVFADFIWPENSSTLRITPSTQAYITEIVDLSIYLPIIPTCNVTADLVVF